MLLDLREVIFVLSGVLDFVGVSDVHHGKRVAFMSHAVGQVLGLSDDHQSRLFEAALLHDAGVSTTREHLSLVSQFAYPDMSWHCRRGHDLLLRCGPLARLAPIVAEHHTPWETLSNRACCQSDDQRLAANIIHLCDRVDALLTRHPDADPTLTRDEIIGILDGESGYRFNPIIVDAFKKASARDAFWFALEPEALHLELKPMARDNRYTALSFPVLIEIASLFAHIVDAKSPFTAAHSVAVGEVSAWLGQKAGLDENARGHIQIAGLLHDIGKLRIPDHILDKPGPLDRTERAIMNRHSYFTYQILRQIEGFGDIAAWAGDHHETLDGRGYPCRKPDTKLPLGSRIIAVADIFQALAQNRPYRDAMPWTRIMDILNQLVAENRLDGDLVALVASHRADLEGGFAP